MVETKSFPANKREALAYLYVKNQDLTGLTPTAILALFDSALDEISAADRAARELKSAARSDVQF